MHGICISDIIRDVLGLNKNGPELCSWIILDVFVILFVVYFYVLFLCCIILVVFLCRIILGVFLCSSSNIVCDNDIVCILQKLWIHLVRSAET